MGKEEEDDYYAKILTGSIIGGVICLITLVIGSLAVCCGFMKDTNLKAIAVGIGLLAGFCMFIPLIAGKVAMDGAVADHCDKCHCDVQDEQEAKDYLSGLGVIIAYTFGFGFVVVILGGVTLCLSCCMCCPCCGPLNAAKMQKQMGAGQPQVIGQPVGMPQTVQS